VKSSSDWYSDAGNGRRGQRDHRPKLVVSAGHAVAFAYCCTGHLEKTSMLKLIWAIHSDVKGRADLSSTQVRCY
jgi:hypothetical protein